MPLRHPLLQVFPILSRSSRTGSGAAVQARAGPALRDGPRRPGSPPRAKETRTLHPRSRLSSSCAEGISRPHDPFMLDQPTSSRHPRPCHHRQRAQQVGATMRMLASATAPVRPLSAAPGIRSPRRTAGEREVPTDRARRRARTRVAAQLAKIRRGRAVHSTASRPSKPGGVSCASRRSASPISAARAPRPPRSMRCTTVGTEAGCA